MKPEGIGIERVANNWTIYGNHLRGFHDGIGTNDDNASGEAFDNLTIKYNRVENIHDDAFEIEATQGGGGSCQRL